MFVRWTQPWLEPIKSFMEWNEDELKEGGEGLSASSPTLSSATGFLSWGEAIFVILGSGYVVRQNGLILIL